MKRKIFNPSLYLDSLRRTALLGGIFTVLLCIQSAIIYFGYLISYTDYNTQTIGRLVETLNALEMNPCILLVPVLLVSLIMLTLFNFQNSRSTSDFWHSTPFKRECLYITFVATTLTWAVAAVVLSTVTSITLFMLNPSFAINFASVIGTALSSIATSLLIAGVLAIASSITGTMLNTLITSAILLFLPRTIMLYFSTLISNGTLFYELPHQGFTSLSLNLIFGLIFSLFFGEVSILELLSNYTSIGYTALLGVVYIAIGLVLFKRRKSETASYSSVNKYLQAAIRIIVAFIVCLVPIYLITECQKEYAVVDSERVFLCFVLYVIATVVYVLYELITTKKAKNMLTSLRALPILAVANIVMIIAINQTYKAEYNYTPTPQNVSAVRISDADGGNTENYFDKMMSMADITDHELETLLCEAYAKTRKAYEDGSIYEKHSQNFTVGFKEGNRYKYREVFMTEEDFVKFNGLMDKNNQIKNIYNIDNIFKNAIHKDLSLYSSEAIELTEQEREKIIETYKNDIKSLSFYEWYYIACNPYDNCVTISEDDVKYYNSIGEIYISINIKGKAYYVNLPIDSRMTKTYQLLMAKLFDYQKANNIQQKIIDGINSQENTGKDVYVELYNGKTKTSPEGYSLNNKAVSQKFIDVITPALSQQPDANSRIATVHYYSEINGEYHRIEGIFKVPDDADMTFFIPIND